MSVNRNLKSLIEGLEDKKLAQANLSGANLKDANLYGADFSKAKNLDKAIWPKGYKLVKE